MSSRAQRPMQSLISLRNAFGFKAVEAFDGRNLAMHEDAKGNAEGAATPRVPLHRCSKCGRTWTRPTRCGDCDVNSDLDGPEGGASRAHSVAPAAADYGAIPETRECEGCGERKPIEEMATVFLPGTGETYQCEQCRGGP